jgi:Fanconi anemia group D2 protein
LAQSKTKTSLTRDMVVKLLSRAHQCVRVHVALVNLTKSHDKSAIHAVAVKYGGKFVDAFLGG